MPSRAFMNALLGMCTTSSYTFFIKSLTYVGGMHMPSRAFIHELPRPKLPVISFRAAIC